MCLRQQYFSDAQVSRSGARSAWVSWFSPGGGALGANLSGDSKIGSRWRTYRRWYSDTHGDQSEVFTVTG
jgi:hypothetical protein